MQTTPFCKRCLLQDLQQEHSLHEIIRDRIALLPDDERTTTAEYRRRLALCKACDQLINGTCLQCGCYVEIRAAKRLLHCPYTESRW